MKAALIASCLFALQVYSQETPTTGATAGLVLVNVTVTDFLNRNVNGLEKTHFRVYEHGVAQPVTYFEQRAVPVTMAVVCRVTGGSTDTYRQLRYAIRRYLESANLQDEFILVAFNDKAAMTERVSRESSDVEGIRSFGLISGLNPMEEAIYAGLNRIKDKGGKKALVLVSTANVGEIDLAWDKIYKVWKLSEQPEFQIYTIRNEGTPQNGRKQKSGSEPHGKTYISSVEEAWYYLDLVYDELRNQYVLGFPAPNPRKAQNALKISVAVDPPKGLPKLKVNAGKGYYPLQP